MERRLLLAGAIAASAGCGRIGFDAQAIGDGGGGDGRGDALDVATGPWGPAALITTINTGMDDQEPSFTADRLEMIFRAGPFSNFDLYVSRRASTNDPWGTPQPITELNTPSADHAPGFSPDGLTLWFASNRTGGASNIWHTTRANRQTPWSPPVETNLPPLGGDKSGPMVDSTGLWFAVGGSTNQDIWHATGAGPVIWNAPVQPLDVDSTDNEGSPRTYGGALHIVFNSTRLTTTTHDLFEGSRASVADPFTNIVPITELNAAGDDWDMWISDDGHYAVFGSDRAGGGLYRLFETSR